MKITVDLPDELSNFASDLEYFVSTMVRKLHTNRHKGTGKDLDPKEMMAMVKEELEEARIAFFNQGQFEFGVECVDIANFAFLAARGSWEMTRKDYNKSRNMRSSEPEKGPEDGGVVG